jgi:FlaA1/EpsC-like NDP-sugar epimerase
MSNRRSLSRILINVLLDGLAGLLAVPLAGWIAAPVAPLPPYWAWLLGAITLLLAGLPFRLPQQYWRFAGIGDLAGVAGAALLGAALLALALVLTGLGLPTATFPVVHALTLLVLLGAPRVVYRLRQGRPRAGDEGRPIVLVGGGEGADLFLRALAAERAPSLRVTGLLTLSARQTGRRIQGFPILGEVTEAAAILDRLAQEGRAPETLVITGPDLTGPGLTALLDVADERGIAVRRAPRPTAL